MHRPWRRGISDLRSVKGKAFSAEEPTRATANPVARPTRDRELVSLFEPQPPARSMTAPSGIAVRQTLAPRRRRYAFSFRFRLDQQGLRTACLGDRRSSWNAARIVRVSINHPGECRFGSMTRGVFAAKIFAVEGSELLEVPARGSAYPRGDESGQTQNCENRWTTDPARGEHIEPPGCSRARRA